MSDEQKKEKVEGAEKQPEAEVNRAVQDEAADSGQIEDKAAKVDHPQTPGAGAAPPMSGEPTAAPGADITKAGGAGEPPGGYAADAAPEPSKEGAKEAASDSPAAESPDATAAAPKRERPARKTESAEALAGGGEGAADADKEAKAKAAAEARAARASARAAKEKAEPDKPKEPSPNQPVLDRLVEAMKQQLGGEAVEEAFINEPDDHLPYIIVRPDRLAETVHYLKHNPSYQLNYLRNVAGIDMETHMEVAYHFISLETKREICVKVKTDRDNPSVPSITELYPTANWNEREIFDLFGIDFPGHPDLRRIMMADDWVGHPLRKDYEPLDPEV